MTRALKLVLAALAFTACTPDFTEAWRATDPRIVAVRIEPHDDRSRARPKKGEGFDIRVFMGTPRKPETPLATRYDAQLELCLGIKLANGDLACGVVDGLPASLPFAGPPSIVSDDELRFDGAMVPSEIANLPPPFDQIDRIALFGAVCVDGKVERIEGKEVNDAPVTDLYRCVDNEGESDQEPLTFTVSVLLDLERPGDDNLHPSFACAEGAAATDACKAGVKVDGENLLAGEFVLIRPKEGDADRSAERLEAWPGATLPWDGCTGTGLPEVHVGDEEYTLRVRFDAADRQVYDYDTVVEDETVRVTAREELRISHALTDLGGDLARHFSVIEDVVPDDEAELELAYTPPGPDDEGSSDLAEGGRLVRIYFALRDERGGVDYTTRELCLLP
jgi:hypothetical protein